MASAAGIVVEVAEDGRHLSLDRGFMVVSEKGRELGRVPLDDMAVLIATAHGLTYSNNLLLALLERDCSVILCGRNFTPAAILWPLDGHHIQAQRMRAQADITDAFKRRLWQAIARAKVAIRGRSSRRSAIPPAPSRNLPARCEPATRRTSRRRRRGATGPCCSGRIFGAMPRNRVSMGC